MTNERPTPETDAFTTSFISIDDPEGNKRWVPSEFARVLERERDEAREALRMLAEHGEKEMQKLIEERDDALSQIYQAECRAERFCQERDEAVKRYEEISRVFEGANEEEWKPCTTLGETITRILKERDEA